MPDDFSLLQSPRAQVYDNSADPGDEESNFVQGFSDLAKKALAKSQPALVANAVTFRVLEKDVEKGDGLGTFIIKLGGEILFIPVVLVENAVKPLDVFYCRSRDRYYPLTPEWLRDVSTSGVSPLGSAIDTPKNRTTDVDIRRLVVPPTIGRFGYASAEPDGWDGFRHLHRKLATDGLLRFPQALSRLPNRSKVAVLASFDRMPAVARLLGAQYGVPTLKEACAPREEKTASVVETPVKKDVYLADAGTSVQELQRELGPGEAARAYSQIRTDGIYVTDRRPKHNEVIALAEKSVDLEEAHGLGLYRFFLHDGSTKVGLAIPSPAPMRQIVQDDSSGTSLNLPRQNRTVLVLFPDGAYAVLDAPLGQPIPATATELDSFIAARAKADPVSGETGVLLGPGPRGVWATEPHAVHEVQRGEAACRWRAEGMSVTRVKGMGGGVTQPTGSRAIFVGEKCAWWPLGRRLTSSEIHDNPALIQRLVMSGLAKTGAVKIAAVRGLGGEFIIGTRREALSGARAVVKLARDYGLTLSDAANVLTSVAGNAPVGFWVKRADAPPPQGGDPNADPNAQMDPSMMGPPAPPPPSGLDLAVAEQAAVIQGQMAALQQQLQLLGQVQQRAMGIDQGGGAMAAPQGATAMMGAPPATVMGMPAMAPMSMPQQGMPQQGMPMGGAPMGMPQQGMPQQGMPQQGMPQQGMPMGGAPMGMPQQGMPQQGMPQGMPMGGAPMGMQQPPQMGMQMGMQPPGMMPGMMPGMPGMPMPAPGQQQMGMPMQPQPQDIPVMTEPPTPETIAGQVSPQFLQDAQVLGDPSVFDAAAIAAFSQPRALQEIFKNYAPVLDNAVDKLGRALILIYTQHRDIRDKLGDEALRTLEMKTRNVFREMGATLRLFTEHGEQVDDSGADSTLL